MHPTTGSRPPLYLGRSRSNGQPVRFTGEGSLLTVGPPGTGKSRGIVAWNLFQYPGSLLVTDPKGELARWSAEHRANTLKQRVAVLDPYRLTPFPSAGYNPLSGLLRAVRKGEGFRGEAERIGQLLLPDVPGTKDPYWRNGARVLTVAACLYLAALHPEDCTLPQVHRLLWKSETALLDVLADMRASSALGGALAEYGENIFDAMKRLERQFANFQQEARQALSIYAPDEPVGRACVGDLDLTDLLGGNMSVYLTLPPHLVASHGRWMGLVAAEAVAAAMAAERAGDCVYLLDEFPNLGRLQSMLSAVAELRSKGLRAWMFVQDVAQLEAVYDRPGRDALLAQAEVLQVLGTGSVELARMIEARAGTRGVHVERFSIPDPFQSGVLPRASVEEQAEPILPAARVLNLARGEQILLRRGYPVLMADLDYWSGDAGQGAAFAAP